MILGQIIVNGLVGSSFYIFVALGITLVYGLTGIIVFCQAELLMLGGFICISVLALTHNFFLGLAASTLSIAVLGLLLERGVFRFTFKEPISGFLISLALITIFQNVAQAIWSADPQFTPPAFPGTWSMGEVIVSYQAMFTLGVMLAAFAVLYFLLYKVRIGKALRAAAEDKEAARLMGVPINTIITAIFVLGSALAGLAGGVLVPMFTVDPWVGGLYLLKAFSIALIGGLGSIPGAVVVGLALGMTESAFGTLFAAEWRDAFSLALMIGVLLLRPQGLFRGAEGGRVR